MDQKFKDLCDEYTEGLIDRREFLKKMAILVGGTAAAVTILPVLEKIHVLAEFVPKDDPRLQVEDITYPGETGDMRAHYARPKGEEKLPGVISISNFPAPITLTDSKSRITGAFSLVIPAISLISSSIFFLSYAGT